MFRVVRHWRSALHRLFIGHSIFRGGPASARALDTGVQQSDVPGGGTSALGHSVFPAWAGDGIRRFVPEWTPDGIRRFYIPICRHRMESGDLMFWKWIPECGHLMFRVAGTPVPGYPIF